MATQIICHDLIELCRDLIEPITAQVTGQNVDKPKRRQPKHGQTETLTNRNVDKPKRRQTKTSIIQNVDRPKHRQTKTSTDQNVDKRKLRQSEISTFHISALYNRIFVLIICGRYFIYIYIYISVNNIHNNIYNIIWQLFSFLSVT